jgi:cyclopropane-fatty-acyl-phospholipid synthase
VSTVERTLREVPPARVSPLAWASRRVVLWALERVLSGGELTVELADGTRYRFGERGGISVSGSVASDRLFARIARRGRIGLGESYVAGEWQADDLPGLFELLLRSGEEAARGRFSGLVRLQKLRPRISTRNGLHRARRNIRYHYDLGNELFRLLLDETMTYSCAVFEAEDTLEEAQRRKLRRVCDKLELRPEDHVLEIGCGWGSFALMAAGEYGARVTGVTISPAQAELTRERIAAAGLADRVAILEQDYRDVEGRFTKIASIEMLEAIGEKEFPVFFAACDRLLAPGGRACVQTILVPDSRWRRYRSTPDWIERYVFPGCLIPCLSALATAMSGASSLAVHDLEEIGSHYAETLHSWRERFFARLADVRDLGYDERFVRTWNFYLAYCEAAFRVRSLRNVQLVLAR